MSSCGTHKHRQILEARIFPRRDPPRLTIVSSSQNSIREAERKSELQRSGPSSRYFSAMPLRVILVGLAIFFVGDLLV